MPLQSGRASSGVYEAIGGASAAVDERTTAAAALDGAPAVDGAALAAN